MALESGQSSLIDITVKTLDGQNRTFNVPEKLNVRQFKEKISSSVEVPADNQRLIFQGRVMQDDKILKDYDIHGKVIHLVQRAPPSSASATSNSTSTAASAPAPDRSHIPMDGNLLDVQIHLGRVQNTPTTREARARLRQADFNLRLVNDVLAQLEQRLGSLSDNSVTQGLSRVREPASTADATTSPDNVVGHPEDSSRDTVVPPVADGSIWTENRDQARPQPQSGTETAGGLAGDVLGLMAADLANFLDQVLSTNERVASHIRLYRDILRSEVTYPAVSREAQDMQEVASRATEVFHALGHMLHSLSDVVVDMSADMPRQAVATPSAPFPFPGIPGATSMAIPIHMNVRARHNSSGRRQRQNQAASATSATTGSTSTVPTASTTASSASFSGASTPTLAAINISSTGPSIRSFQTPPVPLILPPNVTTTGEPSVMVEVLPAGITVHDIRTVVTAAGIDDDSDSSADSIDNIGVNTTDITFTPSVNTGQPLQASAAATAASSAAPSSSASTLPAAAATPVTASTGTFTSSGTSSQAFIFGPGASMNLREVPNFGLGQVPSFGPGQMPRVPGLPSGILQNIVGSILNSHGIRPDQSVQVNVVQQMAEIPTAPPSQVPQQQQPILDSVRVEAQPGTRSQQQSMDQFLSGLTLPGSVSTALLNPFHINISAGSQANTTTSTTSTAAPSSTTATAATISFGSTSRSTFPSSFSWSNPVSQSLDISTDPSSNIRLTSNTRPQFHIHPFGSPSQTRPQHGQPRPPAPGPLRRSYVDPYLPCSSPHYMSQTALATFSAMQTQSRGQQVPDQIPNLSTMVSGMVGEIMEQVTAAANSENRTRSSTTSTSTSSSSTPLRSATASGPGAQQATLNPLEMFTHLLNRNAALAISGASNVQPRNTPPLATSGTTATRPTAAPLGWTLADLFTQVGRTSESSPGDVTIIISLLEAVAPHMGLTDLFSLFMGNTRVLNQLREPLQAFVRRQVTHFGSVDQVVDAALADMYPEIQHIQSLVELKDGLDLAQSLRKCLRIHLTTIFTAIHTDTAGSQVDFGNHMYSLWMKMMADSIGLCIYCMRDGQTGFSNMVQSYMPRMTQGMSPAITVWMTTSLQDIFQSFYHNHPVTDLDIIGYVVKPDPERSAVSTSQGLGQSAVSGSHLSAVSPGRAHVTLNVSPASLSGASSPSPMDTTELLPSQLPQAKVTRLTPEEDLDENDIFEDAQESILGQAPLQNRPNTIAVQASRIERAVERSGNLRNGRSSDDWQSVVPQDWIPVISRDIIRQQNHRSQPPLSDAYLQGLPAKRRRMMALEHADEMGNMPLYLPASLKRAARAADAEPISSEENMAQEAADDLDLQTELEREVIRMLASRITSDQDFTSDRFPNAKEYFHKSNHR